jgi:hypothetical protein
MRRRGLAEAREEQRKKRRKKRRAGTRVYMGQILTARGRVDAKGA